MVGALDYKSNILLGGFFGSIPNKFVSATDKTKAVKSQNEKLKSLKLKAQSLFI